ncbi:MAG: diguanylate cyclase domain-containing protein [Caulobacteraceae bacterium]
MSLHARVLILARDDSLAGPLAEGLDRLGWRTVTARGAQAAIAALADLQIEAAIIDTSGYGEDAEGLAAQVRNASGARRLPVIAIGQPQAGEAAAYDLTLAAPLHPAQAAARLETLVRTATAQEELGLRTATFAERGATLDPGKSSDAPWRILAVGEPAPRFLALSNALTAQGAQVVGAFTAYTAFDYLHEQPFEAVILWGGDDEAEALSIAAGMRRNTRLYHIPAVLYLRANGGSTLSEVFHRGVSDITTHDTPDEETADRVIELARAYRRQVSIRKALNRARSSGLMDAATGLFTRDLFAAHLARLTRSALARNRALSVCVLRLTERAELKILRAEGWVDKAVPQIGSMIGRLVRAEDTAARLAPDTFALALPATPLQSARAAAERISAVIGCTAFDAGEGRPPFVVEFDIGVAQVEPGESAGRALERAAARLQAKAG